MAARAAVVALAVRAAAAAASSGDAACACIDAWAQAAPIESRSGWDASRGCLVVPDGACVPPGYGTSCATWAGPVPECGAASPPKWCASQWCYVNATTCQRPKAQSAYVPEFHFSYATCGYLDDYSESKHSAYLQGRTVRVSFPGDSGSGYTVITRDEKRVGSFPAFVQSLFERYNMTMELVPVSETSKEWSPKSSFTACVHEVALNRTDMCIGNFWATSQRRLIAPFTSEVYQDLFYIIAFSTEEEQGILELMTTPFRPLTPMLWLGIALVTVLASLVMYFLERGKSMFREKPVHRGMLFSIYTGFNSMIGGGSSYESKSPGGRILNLTFGLFIMIVIASYTAELASFLVAKSTSSKIESIEAGIDAGMKFCGLVASQGSLLSFEPDLNKLYVPVSNDKQALAGMDEGICQLAILSADSFESAQRGTYTPDAPQTHCNKMAVGDVLTAIGNAMPIRSDLQEPMSWAMTVQMSGGGYDAAVVEAKRTYLSPNACGAEADEVEAEGMQLGEMMGIFIIIASGMVLGLLANFFYFGSLRAASRLSAKEEDPPAESAEPSTEDRQPTIAVIVENLPKCFNGPAPRFVVRYLD